jgi:hypothetical protein
MFFFTPKRPDLHWSLANLVTDLEGNVKLSTIGFIPSLHHTPSWPGVVFNYYGIVNKQGGKFTCMYSLKLFIYTMIFARREMLHSVLFGVLLARALFSDDVMMVASITTTVRPQRSEE